VPRRSGRFFFDVDAQLDVDFDGLVELGGGALLDEGGGLFEGILLALLNQFGSGGGAFAHGVSPWDGIGWRFEPEPGEKPIPAPLSSPEAENSIRFDAHAAGGALHHLDGGRDGRSVQVRHLLLGDGLLLFEGELSHFHLVGRGAAFGEARGLAIKEDMGGCFVMNVKLRSSNTVMTAGMIIPGSMVFVRSLNCLQKSMMLMPCWPRAGPTGGAGLAAPAGI